MRFYEGTDCEKGKLTVTQTRSPAYPGIHLGQAIVLAEKIYLRNRSNPIDREAASKDMGFAGITGSSTKALADLAHYGLVEKAGKGSIRVSQQAVAILYPANPAEKLTAMQEAAFSPILFKQLHAHFHDSLPSENSIRGYLMRAGFITTVIPAIIVGFLETCRLVQQPAAIESHSHTTQIAQDAFDGAGAHAQRDSESRAQVPVQMPPNIPAPSNESRGVKLLNSERIVFIEESGPDNYLKLVANGELDEMMLEALEDYIKRQKKRIAFVLNKELTN